MTKQCIICGNNFQEWRKTQLLCSPICRLERDKHRRYRRRRRNPSEAAVPFLTKTCIICEKEFLTKRDNQTSCSKECRFAWLAEIQRRYRKAHPEKMKIFHKTNYLKKRRTGKHLRTSEADKRYRIEYQRKQRALAAMMRELLKRTEMKI